MNTASNSTANPTPTASGLTPDDIRLLEAPLPVSDHEARAGGKNKAGTKQQWLIYINQEGIIPLLNRIDPDWTWEVRETRKSDRYVAVTGRLTLKGVSRDGTGGNSPNGSSSPVDEDTEKGAETDALKRAAVRFGVGLYLRSVDTIWVDITDKPWEDEKTALATFGRWYSHEFKAVNHATGEITRPAPPPPAQQPQPQAPAPNASTPPQSSAAPTAPTSANGGSDKPSEPIFAPSWVDKDGAWEAFLKSAQDKLSLSSKSVGDALESFAAMGLADWTQSRNWALAALIAYAKGYNREAISNYTAGLPGKVDDNLKLDQLAQQIAVREAEGMVRL